MAENSGTGNEEEERLKEQAERWLPIANVGRIMKKNLPANAKISKDAKETMQECVSEFIGFVTGEASEKCRKERRKTVNGDDICWAMAALGFDDYAGPLKQYLERYREQEGERANQERVISHEEIIMDNNNNNTNNNEDYPPPSSSSFPLTFKSMPKPY